MDKLAFLHHHKLLWAAMIISMVTIISGCQSSNVHPKQEVPTSKTANTVSVNTASTEKALAPETSPFGDIPDSQVFVKYNSAEGNYTMEVPEGWSCTVKGANVIFLDKFDGVSVDIVSYTVQPTIKDIESGSVADLEKKGRAVQVQKVSAVNLPGGSAIEADFHSNSEPDPVTGKQVRLENKRYYFFHDGKEAQLTLWAPQGADNVDQWQEIAESFRWNP